MKNIKNEVYNALANIMFETGANKEDMNEAIKWFKLLTMYHIFALFAMRSAWDGRRYMGAA